MCSLAKHKKFCIQSNMAAQKCVKLLNNDNTVDSEVIYDKRNMAAYTFVDKMYIK